MHRRTLSLSLAAMALAAALAPAAGLAQSRPAGYPAKPVTIIVPFTPGQSGDVLARILGEPLGKRWGQSLVVENKGGAGGTVGSKAAAAAPADGYTLLLGSSGPLAVAPNLYANPGYNPRELTPIMNVAGVAQAFVVPANSPYKTLQDLITAARQPNSTLSYGSGGVGSFQHLTFELLKQRTGAAVRHIPYRGSGPAYTDLMGGQLHAMVDSLPGVLPHVQSGKLRVLAVSTSSRVPQLPDVPTVAESGIANFDALGWLGIVGPKGMDPALAERINADIKAALAEEPVKARLATLGMITIASTPGEFGKFIETELAKWGSVIKAAGIQPE